MEFPLGLIFFLLFPQIIIGKWTVYNDDISYEDVKSVKDCNPYDSCKEERIDDLRSIGYDYTCSCDKECSKYGVCCADSPYRGDLPHILECKSVKENTTSGYFMISRCPIDTDRDSVWKQMCEEGWNEEDDILKLAPVTSLESYATYKNYYCYRCHEETDNILSWNIFLKGHKDSDDSSEDDDYSISYNQTIKSWMAVKEFISMPVRLEFLVPYEARSNLVYCKEITISSCNETWTDNDVRDKCNAYTAIVHISYNEFLTYKNPHCALCNFESVQNILCEADSKVSIFDQKEIFSFSHLLNIHRSKEDEKKPKCEKNELWDPYGRKCRKIRCAVPGYVIKDGRCSVP